MCYITLNNLDCEFHLFSLRHNVIDCPHAGPLSDPPHQLPFTCLKSLTATQTNQYDEPGREHHLVIFPAFSLYVTEFKWCFCAFTSLITKSSEWRGRYGYRTKDRDARVSSRIMLAFSMSCRILTFPVRDFILRAACQFIWQRHSVSFFVP